MTGSDDDADYHQIQCDSITGIKRELAGFSIRSAREIK
jgi:hypothetical protein